MCIHTYAALRVAAQRIAACVELVTAAPRCALLPVASTNDVIVDVVFLHTLTTWCYWRLVQMQQETCSKYAMNLVTDIR